MKRIRERNETKNGGLKETSSRLVNLDFCLAPTEVWEMNANENISPLSADFEIEQEKRGLKNT